MVRGFRLLNEKGQEFSMMDIHNYCLLTEPSGLGLSYSAEYEKLGYSFIQNMRNIEQGQITGIVNFLEYDNYRKFINFVETAENLRIVYKIPYKSGTREYFKDIEINSLTKSEIQENGIISESITIDCLSLWYEEVDLTYNIVKSEVEDLIRWDFRWDSRFDGTADSEINIVNQGHVEAPIVVEINGRVINPYIKLSIDGEEYQRVTFNVEIAEYEKLLYGTKENDFYILKQNTDGTKQSLFNLDVINFENDNVIRIPRNRSCKLQIYAENEISDIKATIYIYYKSV